MENIGSTLFIDFNTIAYNHFESLYWGKNALVCGIDEVGRGPLAGPVVAAACILPKNAAHPLIKDSKLLSVLQLEKAFSWIAQHGISAIGVVDNQTVDTIGIVRATHCAMKKALLHLLGSVKSLPSAVIIDAVMLDCSSFASSFAAYALYKAELKSISVAAASIVAKVWRDRLMLAYEKELPYHLFGKHKGYGTALHYESLGMYGLSIIHRKSFLKGFLAR